MYECCILSFGGCVGVGRLWDINRSWFQRPLLTRLYVRASIQLSLSHCSLVTGWSACPCDLSFWEILRQAVHMWWHLKAGFLGGNRLQDEKLCRRHTLVSELKTSKLKEDVFLKKEHIACRSGWNHWMRAPPFILFT